MSATCSRAEAAEHAVLPGDQRRRRVPNPVHKVTLLSENLLPRGEQIVRFIEVLKQVELDLGFQRVKTRADRVCETCLRVRQIERKPRVILDQPDRATARLDSLLRERVEIDHRAAGDEELMDVAQGVHDALSLNSSQGMREERQVERHMRGVHLGRPRDRERNAIGELGR
jgi:hypothetical protein